MNMREIVFVPLDRLREALDQAAMCAKVGVMRLVLLDGQVPTKQEERWLSGE